VCVSTGADVVTAYKELQREKIALEESLKALSVPRSHSDGCEEKTDAAAVGHKDMDVPSYQQDADVSELSDSLVMIKYFISHSTSFS